MARPNNGLTPDDPCIARALRAAGYYTGHVGKWHGNFTLGAPLEFTHALDPDDPATDAMLRTRNAQHAAAVQQLTGFDEILSLQVGNLDHTAKIAPKLGAHNPEWQTQGTLNFIARAAQRGQPFFLHLANTVPHSPDNLVSLEQDARYTQAGKLPKPPASHPPRPSVRERLQRAGVNTSGPIATINAVMAALGDQLCAVHRCHFPTCRWHTCRRSAPDHPLPCRP